MSVGRIDRSLTPRGAEPRGGRDQPGGDAFADALAGSRPAVEEPRAAPPPPSLPADTPEFLDVLPRSLGPMPEQFRWQAPTRIRGVAEALRTLASIDRPTVRRLLARFGGALDAGQLGYVLDSGAEVAASVIALLDEVGDGRIGDEELEPDSLRAALEAIGEGDAPEGARDGDAGG